MGALARLLFMPLLDARATFPNEFFFTIYIALNKPENAFFLYELWLDRMLDHHVHTKIRQGTLVFPPCTFLPPFYELRYYQGLI